jgi:hypothetical protein
VVKNLEGDALDIDAPVDSLGLKCDAWPHSICIVSDQSIPEFNGPILDYPDSDSTASSS